MKCARCGVPIAPCNMEGTEFTHIGDISDGTPCDNAQSRASLADLLPTIGETVEHIGKTYECVEVRWDREEDCIDVEYRRKYHEDGRIAPDRFGGQQASLAVVDEAFRFYNNAWKRDTPEEGGA